MQRLQRASAALPAESVPDLPLPSGLEVRSLPLLQRLDALREPDVTQGEVDLFLEGLSTILPAHESRRERADLMLDVLEDSRLCELTGSDGTQVGTIALEVLLELGYPYALEITPAMLARVRGPERRTLPRSVLAGLGLTVGTGLLSGVLLLPTYLDNLQYLRWHHTSGGDYLRFHGYSDTDVYLPLFLTRLFGPSVLTGMSWLFNWRRPRLLFNTLQWLSGAWALWFGVRYAVPELLPLGVLTVLGAFCLRPRAQPEPQPPAPPALRA